MGDQAWAPAALGEEAALYGYEVLAAQLAGSERLMAQNGLKAHERARDRARDFLASAGENPDVPTVFTLPFRVDSAAKAKELAILLDLRLVSVYSATASATEGPAREYAATTAQECATRAVGWGWRPTAFPGAETSESGSQPGGSPGPRPGTVSDGAHIE